MLFCHFLCCFNYFQHHKSFRSPVKLILICLRAEWRAQKPKYGEKEEEWALVRVQTLLPHPRYVSPSPSPTPFHPFCPKQGHFLSFVISNLKPICLRLIDFSWIEHLLSPQRRRMQSASKAVEKMKKRLAEQVTWLNIIWLKVLTFMWP